MDFHAEARRGCVKPKAINPMDPSAAAKFRIAHPPVTGNFRNFRTFRTQSESFYFGTGGKMLSGERQ